MTLYELFGWLSAVLMLVPICLLIYFKLAFYRSFPALVGYFFVAFSCNLLLLDLPDAGLRSLAAQDAIYNILSLPLIIIFISYFARNINIRLKILVTATIIIAFQVAIVLLKGFTLGAYRMLMVPALLMAFCMGCYYFAHQVKLTVIYQKALGKAILATSMFFATIGIGFIYAVRHYIHPSYRADTDIIQFMVGIVVAVSASIGILLERRRVQQLEELRIAREELREIYGQETEKATGPFGSIAFHFENESWN